MRQVKISAGISGVISTGSYQNLKPAFLWEETIDNCEMTDEEILNRIKGLYEKSYDQLKQAELQALAERIERERKDIRLYKKDGRVYPSVTSIINYDRDYFIGQEDLQQYASQGNITHALVEEFIKTGKQVEPKELPQLWTDIVIVSKGSLGLPIINGNFAAFLESYPIKDKKNGEEVYNDEYLYAGKPDFTGIPEFKDVEKVLTVFDVKRTPDKIKNGMQLAAYCRCVGAKQGIIIPLNGETKQGFSKPIIYSESVLEGYFEMFSQKRKEFKRRYQL